MEKFIQLYLVFNLLIGIVLGLLFFIGKDEDNTFVAIKDIIREIPILMLVVFVIFPPATILTFLIGLLGDMICLLKYPLRWLMDVNDKFVEWRDNR